ncbi:HlyD family secretion protein [Lactovum odontotermitis]
MFEAKKLESGEFYHRRTENFATLIIFPILGIFIFLLIFAFFAKKELTVKSAATIEPTKIIQRIQSTNSGKILENVLKEGKTVKDGQILLRYDIASDATQQADYQAQLEKAQDQKSQLTFLQNSLNTGSNQFPVEDSYGYYQTFEDYLSQCSVLTSNINKSNQTLTDQNTSNQNTRSSIQEQTKQMNQKISDLKALKSAVSSGKTPDSSNPYYSQYTDYQSQLADNQSQIQTLQAQFTATIQGSIDQVQSQIDTLNTQILQLQSEDTTAKSKLNRQVNTLKQQIKDYTEVKNASSSTSISSSNPYKAQFDATQGQISSLKSQASSLQSQLISNLQGQIDTLQAQLDSLNTQSAGLTNSNNYDTSLNGQLSSLKSEAQLKASQEMTVLDTNITDLQTKLKLLSQTSQDGTLKTSSAGILHVLPNILGVKKIPVGTEIAEIYPAFNENSQVKITAYIPASQISAVSTGQKMRFQVQQNLPKPVILTGKVTKIDSAATKDKTGSYYGLEAVITLKKTDLEKVRYGLQGKLTIITGKKTYFNYYKDKVMGND